jgi:hypothetical protein
LHSANSGNLFLIILCVFFFFLLIFLIMNSYDDQICSISHELMKKSQCEKYLVLPSIIMRIPASWYIPLPLSHFHYLSITYIFINKEQVSFM